MYTTKEVAEELRVSTRTVQRLISARQIASVRVGGQRRIPKAALSAYLARWTYEAS